MRNLAVDFLLWAGQLCGGLRLAGAGRRLFRLAAIIDGEEAPPPPYYY